jgi:murein peptide amidase A
VIETREIGRSVSGRPISAVRRGTPGGRVVLVIGVIHGDEDAGIAIVDLLKVSPVPKGVDLWLIEAMNPDGVANQVRQNGNQVDLNRNFPRENWAPLGEPGYWEYGGPSAGSEPETAAIVGFVTEIRPDLTIWYHQDLYRISPGTGRTGAYKERYAALTGLPLVAVTGGTYTGTAAPWISETVEGSVSFIVELGDTLSPEEAVTHANAVLALSVE